jgi:hypothetical protein
MERLIQSLGEGVMPLGRCSIARSSVESSKLPESPKKLLRCLTTSPCQKFRALELSVDLIKNLFGFGLLDFDPNYFKLIGNLEKRLEEVSYWDKTTPSIYMRGSWPPSIQSSKHNKSIYYISFTLSSPLLVILTTKF